MATHGTLELRVKGETLYASTTHDGYEVYEFIPQLADYLDQEPDDEYLKRWFRATSKKLIPYNYSTTPYAGYDCKVIVDAADKIIFHNSDIDDLLIMSDTEKRFKQAFDKLTKKFGYQILGISQEGQVELRSQ